MISFHVYFPSSLPENLVLVCSMQNLEHVISHVLLIYILNEQLHYMPASHSHVSVIELCAFLQSFTRQAREVWRDETECVFL